jgi:lactoylglutathione lyase
MKLNHVNLPVADVSATRDFFEKHFGFHRIAEPTDDNVVLTDNAGLVLTVSNFDHVDQVAYPKWFHVGFMQDSDDRVDEINDQLKKAGMQPGKPEHMHGAGPFTLPLRAASPSRSFISEAFCIRGGGEAYLVSRG